MPEFTRRRLALEALGLVSASELASALQHAHQAAASSAAVKFEYLDPGTAREIEAIASEIIPSDDSPGAKEAGVIYFIDRALKTWESEKRGIYRKGLEQLQQKRAAMFPLSSTIAGLSPAQRQQMLAAVEKSEFFEILRAHTVMGFLGSPAHGGNRGRAGWAHIGLEDEMRFEPPFGSYDAGIGKKNVP
jgi:gluconate 2-dehydrogenase gamma chain